MSVKYENILQAILDGKEVQSLNQKIWTTQPPGQVYNLMAQGVNPELLRVKPTMVRVPTNIDVRYPSPIDTPSIPPGPVFRIRFFIDEMDTRAGNWGNDWETAYQNGLTFRSREDAVTAAHALETIANLTQRNPVI